MDAKVAQNDFSLVWFGLTVEVGNLEKKKKKTWSQNVKFGAYKVLNGISRGMALRSSHGDIMMYFCYYLIILNNLYMQKKMHNYILISNISI